MVPNGTALYIYDYKFPLTVIAVVIFCSPLHGDLSSTPVGLPSKPIFGGRWACMSPLGGWACSLTSVGGVIASCMVMSLSALACIRRRRWRHWVFPPAVTCAGGHLNRQHQAANNIADNIGHLTIWGNHHFSQHSFRFLFLSFLAGQIFKTPIYALYSLTSWLLTSIHLFLINQWIICHLQFSKVYDFSLVSCSC